MLYIARYLADYFAFTITDYFGWEIVAKISILLSIFYGWKVIISFPRATQSKDIKYFSFY
jgi:hypothetical protein